MNECCTSRLHQLIITLLYVVRYTWPKQTPSNLCWSAGLRGVTMVTTRCRSDQSDTHSARQGQTFYLSSPATLFPTTGCRFCSLYRALGQPTRSKANKPKAHFFK